MREVEVIVKKWCDGHGGEGDEHIPATIERTISLDGRKPVLLDLCEDCDQNVIVVAELMEHGAPVKEKRKRKSAPKVPEIEFDPDTGVEDPKTTTTCPRCGHVSPTRSALGAHSRGTHEVGLRELFA